MKKISTVTTCLVLIILLTIPCAGADYKKGLDAYKKSDYRKALSEWLPLAKQGHPEAQLRVGTLYYDGSGVTKDLNMAFYWFELSARNGMTLSQAILGSLYMNGHGVTTDFQKAFYWAEKAAEQGEVLGQALLGVLYSDGLGIPQDNVKAYMWYSLAASSGFKPAYNSRVRIARKMTVAQITKAHNLASNWKPMALQDFKDSVKSNFTSNENMLLEILLQLGLLKEIYPAAKNKKDQEVLLTEFTKLKRQQSMFIKKQH